MDIFISWSGQRGGEFAGALRDWLPLIIQCLRPFISTVDISKGKRWNNELAQSLNDTNFGIIVITPESLTSGWLLFEAGALSKNISQSRVCTILFDIEETEVQSPLADFQNTKITKSDIRKLLHDINELLDPEKKLKETILNSTFEKMWPDLEARFKQAQDIDISGQAIPKRTDREILDEILVNIRNLGFDHFLSRFYGNKFGQKNIHVEFDPNTYTIIFQDDDERIIYEISAASLFSTGEMLDFIFQILNKTWSTPQTMFQFLTSLEAMTQLLTGSSVQSIYCPGGAHSKVDLTNKRIHRLKEISDTNDSFDI